MVPVHLTKERSDVAVVEDEFLAGVATEDALAEDVFAEDVFAEDVFAGFNDFWLGERDARTATIDAKLALISDDTISKFINEWDSSSRSSQNCDVFILPCLCVCVDWKSPISSQEAVQCFEMGAFEWYRTLIISGGPKE